MFFILLLITLSTAAQEIRLKPYIMAGIDAGSLAESATRLEQALINSGFNVIGKYAPMQAENRLVICTSHELLTASVNKIGGLTAFASVFRFGLYQKNDGTEVSYMNPPYWGNAYFRKSFPEVEQNYQRLENTIQEMFKSLSLETNQQYGSEKGLTVKKLRKYHYMMAMPYFDDVKKLAKKTEYNEILTRINTNFDHKIGGVEKVYEIHYPESELSLIGVALNGSKGEGRFIPKIDYNEPYHITFMPYEFLVMKDRVVMLHGKFRIALSFPDLTMGTFMKIMSTPGDIANAIRLLTIGGR